MHTGADDFRTLQLDAAVIRRVIDELDRETGRAPESAARPRGDARYPYRIRALSVDFGNSLGGWATHSLPTHSLSRTGCALLTGSYLYSGAACRVHLVTLQNLVRLVSGRVVRCRYLAGTGRLYETEIQFDESIDVAWFCRGAASLRALLVESAPNPARPIPVLLDDLNCEFTRVSGSAQALALIEADSFDAAIVDVDGMPTNGLNCVAELRRAGFTRPIAVVMTFSEDAVRRQYMETGATQIYLKPLEKRTFAEGMKALVEAPIVSSLAADAAAAPLIDAFVSSLPARINTLETAFAAGRIESLRQAGRELREQALALGFQALARPARALETTTQVDADRAPLHRALCEISRIARAVRPANGRAAPAAPVNVLFRSRALPRPS